jgi:predicted O-methyltransferase YrrM
MNTLDYIIRKYNIDSNGKLPIEILKTNRLTLADLFAELGFTKGVEIGVLFGRYSQILCERNKNLHLYAIDPWLVYPGFKTEDSQEQQEALYERAKIKLAPYNCTIIRKKSMDAIKDFEDNSLDFVYIDGNHEFTSEANDIHEWSKKVRVGGIISGHDYKRYLLSSNSHSYEVVNAYTGAYRIKPWFVLGAKNEVGRESVRSWFWVKT